MEEQIRSKRRLRKLNLNAPILSTRRAGTTTTTITTTTTTIPSWSSDQNSHLDWCRSFHDTSARIPFSWEQVPGTPKGFARETAAHSNINPPRPSLPPCRWHPRNGLSTRSGDDDDDDDDDIGSYDKGLITGDNDHQDVFSDAVDVFSLSESLDVVNSTLSDDQPRRLNSLDDDHIDIVKSRVNRSPNFIIRRFLPDANALAFYATPSHIVSSKKNLIDQKHPIPSNICQRNPIAHQMVNSQGPVHCVPPRVAATGQANPPPKACGIGLLLPWRMKHTLCGSKSPVMQGFQSAKVNGNARQSHSSSDLQEGPFCMSTVEDSRVKCNNKG